MRLLAAIATAATLSMVCSGFGCSTPESGFKPRTRSAAVVARQQLDGAFTKIYGGKASTFVFRTASPNTEEASTFFAEFEESDGTIVRAEGIFSYDHDDLGNYIELKRATSQTKSLDASVPTETSSDGGSTNESDAAPSEAEAGAPPKDPTAAVYGIFHFVKTGEHKTLLTKDARDRIYQFQAVNSYCGTRGAADCKADTQRVGACSSKWTCTDAHRCVCGTTSQ